MGRPLNVHHFGDRYDIAARNQIKVQAYLNGSVQDAYLLQQKSKYSFIAISTNGLYKSECVFVNSASPTAGQMSCVATNNASGTFYISRVTNKFVWDFTSPIKVKYRWHFTIQPDAAIADYPNFLQVSLPYDSKAADPVEAP
jgi:hypothetical protein